MLKHRPYVISSPPWDTTSGGIRVMYGLYGWLLAKGQEVYMNQRPSEGDVIGIYPEIQQGNPANAGTVVRYILNRPGVMGGIVNGEFIQGPTQFDKTDILYYFSRLFGDGPNYMFLPILDLHLFKDQKKKRTRTAFFQGKGLNYDYNPIHPDDSFLIDRHFASNQAKLADFLNECHTLYCYDPVSAMTELARLCGVRVVMINPLYTKEEFSKYEPGVNGISWGKDEGIELDTQSFRTVYKNMVRDFSLTLDKFIQDTQNA